MLLSELLKDVDYSVLCGNTDISITQIVYDSRKVCPNCVFFCLKGASFDGHSFANEAVDKGAIAVITEDDISCEGCTLIKVDDTRKALALASCTFFDYPASKLKTIAITGTKGKTTTAGMIKYILEQGNIKTGIIGTLGIVLDDRIIKTNNTTPESYEIQSALKLMLDEGYKAVAIEASSLGFKWHRTDGIMFDYGVFTNFSHDHIGGNEHKDMEEYLDCKAMLFKQCKLGLVNIDDENVSEIISSCTCEIESFGFNENALLRCTESSLISRPGFLGVHIKTEGALDLSADVAVPGKFNAYNALAALSVCRHFDIPQGAFAQGLAKVKVKGRVEPVDVKGDYTLLIDYAHNALSMENVLTTLREYKPSRLITLFGAGGNRPKVRRFEMGEVSGRMSDLSVITEDNSRFEDVIDIISDILTGIKKTEGSFVVIPNRMQAIKYCIQNARKGDIIVLAGKGHEDYQEIQGIKHHLDEREVISDILDGKY